MATGRVPGPIEVPLSLAGRVINDPWPLGLNPQPTALKAKPKGGRQSRSRQASPLFRVVNSLSTLAAPLV